MKRLWLRNPGDPHIVDGKVYGDPDLVRRASIALARYATDAAGAGGRPLGDAVFEKVTEGRAHAPNYSSCGDLANWILRCLGVRDEALVNRNDDGGDHPWAVGQNLSDIVYGEGSRFNRTPGDAPPEGAILYVVSPEHVCVLGQFSPQIGQAITGDYGQWKLKPFGGVCGLWESKSLARSGGRWIVGGKTLLGFLDVALVPLDASAIVPDDFEGGEPLPGGSQGEGGVEV